MVGEVRADVALLAGQDDVALDKRRVQRAVNAGAGLLHPLDVRCELQELGRHVAEQHIGILDLAALLVAVGGQHHGPVSSGVADPVRLGVGQR